MLFIILLQVGPVSRTLLSAQQVELFNDYCRKRVARLPVQYILGEWSFHNISLKMRPPVFIPRPETEDLVNIVLSHIKEIHCSSLLDIGCGTGAISLALSSASKVYLVYTGLLACTVGQLIGLIFTFVFYLGTLHRFGQECRRCEACTRKCSTVKS